jgi:hypothetical protein
MIACPFGARNMEIKEIAELLQTAKCVLRFNKPKSVKQVEQRYQTAFGMDLLHKPSLYVFH